MLASIVSVAGVLALFAGVTLWVFSLNLPLYGLLMSIGVVAVFFGGFVSVIMGGEHF